MTTIVSLMWPTAVPDSTIAELETRSTDCCNAAAEGIRFDNDFGTRLKGTTTSAVMRAALLLLLGPASSGDFG